MAEQSYPPACQPDGQGQGDAQAHPGDPIRQAARGRKDQKHGKYDAADKIEFVHFVPSPIKRGGAGETRSEERVPFALGEVRQSRTEP